MTFYGFMRMLFAPWIRMLFPTEVVNKQNFDEMGGGVVICNHYAVPDTLIPAIKLYKNELNVIAKAEAFKSKIGNRFLRGIGAIPVKRGEPDLYAFKACMQVLKDDKKLLIYPEGTRNKEGTADMKPFKQGVARMAIRARKPVLPMVYFRMHKIFRKNWLYIGEPISMEKFYDAKRPEEYEEATKYIYDKMVETRLLLNGFVAQKRPKLVKQPI